MKKIISKLIIIAILSASSNAWWGTTPKQDARFKDVGAMFAHAYLTAKELTEQSSKMDFKQWMWDKQISPYELSFGTALVANTDGLGSATV